MADRKKDLQHDDDDDLIIRRMTVLFEGVKELAAYITSSFEKFKEIVVCIDLSVSQNLQRAADRKKDVEHDDDDQITRINDLLTAIFESFKPFVADSVLEIENYVKFLRKAAGEIVSSTPDDRVKDRLHEAIRGITNTMIMIYPKLGSLLEALGFKKKLVLIDIEGFASDIEKLIKGTADATFKKSEEEETQHGAENNNRIFRELEVLLETFLYLKKNGARIESHDAAKENTTTEATFKKSEEEEDAQHALLSPRFKMEVFQRNLTGLANEIIEIDKLMKGDACQCGKELKDTQIESHPLAANAAKGNTTTSTAKTFKKTEEDAPHEVEDRNRSMRCCAMLWANVCIWKKNFQWFWEEFHGRNNIHQPPNYPSIYILSKKL
nr:hypothetical protein Iba_scaffold15261CG0440 [Ipomoea batatas]